MTDLQSTQALREAVVDLGRASDGDRVVRFFFELPLEEAWALLPTLRGKPTRLAAWHSPEDGSFVAGGVAWEAQVHGEFRVRPLAVGAGEHQVAHPRLGGDIPFRIEHRGGNPVIEITRISRQRQPDLPEIGGATGSLRLVFCLAERREQQRGENGNNGDHHQQLD